VLKMALSGEKKHFFLCCCPLFLKEKLKHNMSAFTKMYSFSYRQVNPYYQIQDCEGSDQGPFNGRNYVVIS
jgi:hypothetical protein